MTVDEYRTIIRKKMVELGRNSAKEAGRALEDGRELDNAYYEGETMRSLEDLKIIDEDLVP